MQGKGEDVKKELYAEMRALVVAHQGGWASKYALTKRETCSHCDGRWEKVKAVLDKIVDNAEAIREDAADEARKAARMREFIENLPTRKLPPRRR